MPRYVYKCNTCNETLTVNHLSTETQTDCPACEGSSTLTKMLTTFTTAHKGALKTNIGNVTEEFIQDSRSELERTKDELEKNR